jgi:hypothetical protein
MGEVRNVYTTCIGKHEGKTTVWMWEANIKIVPERACVWTGFKWFRCCPVVGYCEQDRESSHPILAGIFFTSLINYSCLQD